MKKENPFQRKWWALIGVCLLAFTAFLDATIVNTALPFIQSSFNITVLQLQWVGNIFTIILSMSMMAIGKIADSLGRRKVFYMGVFFFTLGAIGGGMSPTIECLIFFRGMQALGASTLFITAAALLSDVFPIKERVKAISIYGGITGCGLMFGPFLGGVLIDLLNWRWVFWINLPIIAIGLIACLFSLKNHHDQKQKLKLDWVGLLYLVLGLGSLMYGIITGAQENWQSGKAWYFLIIGILGLTLLIQLDTKKQNPLLNLNIFKKNLIKLAAMSCALAGVVSTVFMFFDPLYLRILRQLSPFSIGVLIAIIPAAQSIISIVFEKLLNWWGITHLLFLAIVSACIAVGLHHFLSNDTPILFLLIPFFLLGITWGLGNIATITALNELIKPAEMASAMGTITTIWNLVGSILLALSTALFHYKEKQGSFLDGFQGVIHLNFFFALIILTIAIWIKLKLKRKKSG
jgi:EmrB/QacA subfamily drug resistance transporter